MRRREGQLGLLARIEQPGGLKDLRRLGHVEPQICVRFRQHLLRGLADFLESAWRHNHEVVLHGVVVLENDLHRLADFHDNERLVVEHLFGEGADNEDAGAQRPDLFAERRGFFRRQQRGQVRGELKRTHGIRLGAFIDRHAPQVSGQALNQRLRLVPGPGPFRQPLQAGHRGGQFDPRFHQRGQRVERLHIVAGHGGNGRDRRAPNLRRLGFAKERFNLRVKSGAKICVANQRN